MQSAVKMHNAIGSENAPTVTIQLKCIINQCEAGSQQYVCDD